MIDQIREIAERWIQKPVKDLRWNSLQRLLIADNLQIFPQKATF